MRDYGRVHSTFWSSPTVSKLSEDGRMLALYLMTCSHATIAGVFRLPDGYASEDLRWTPERVRQGFENLEANGFATRCEDTKWVWVIKHLEWNAPENPNQMKAARKCALSIPDECAFKQAFMRVCAGQLGIGEQPSANPSRTVAEPSPNQEQEQKEILAPAANCSDGKKALGIQDLIAEGVPEELARDYLQTRKAKKAPLTRTALDAIKREAAVAGMSLEQAVRYAAENGWQGFKASWVTDNRGKAGARVESPWAGAQ